MTTTLTGPEIAAQIIEDWIDRYTSNVTSDNAYHVFQVMVLVTKAHACSVDDDLDDAMWSAYDAIRSMSGDKTLTWSARQVYRNFVAGI